MALIFIQVYVIQAFEIEIITVCDIQEPFRCIVDKIIKRAIDLGQFKRVDFKISEPICIKTT